MAVNEHCDDDCESCENVECDYYGNDFDPAKILPVDGCDPDDDEEDDDDYYGFIDGDFDDKDCEEKSDFDDEYGCDADDADDADDDFDDEYGCEYWTNEDDDEDDYDPTGFDDGD